MALKKEGLERVGIRLPEEVKEWYMKESLSLGLTMSQYMSYILVNFKRNQESVQALKVLSDMSTSEDVKEANKEVIELLKNPAFKEFMNSGKPQLKQP